MPDQVATYIGDRIAELSDFLWRRLTGGEFGDKDYARILFKLDALCVRGDKLVTELLEIAQAKGLSRAAPVAGTEPVKE